MRKPRTYRRTRTCRAGKRKTIILSAIEGFAIAVAFAFVAPAVLVVGIMAYGYLSGHAGVEIEWNIWGGFADPVGRGATALVFCIAAAIRYRKRQ